MSSESAGQKEIDQELYRRVYEELRKMAARIMSRESEGQTLQPTALVHEALFRVTSLREWKDQSPAELERLFAAAANAMRQILIDAARRRASAKRGGNLERNVFQPEEIAAPERAEELLALDEALDRLAEIRPVVAKLVNLRYFGGLTIRECATALGLSPRTADSYWAFAKAWLSREMRGE